MRDGGHGEREAQPAKPSYVESVLRVDLVPKPLMLAGDERKQVEASTKELRPAEGQEISPHHPHLTVGCHADQPTRDSVEADDIALVTSERRHLNRGDGVGVSPHTDLVEVRLSEVLSHDLHITIRGSLQRQH